MGEKNCMLNIVVPMAGRGSRFALKGYPDPKPLIPVNGKAMIELVIENLRPKSPHRFIFLCLTEHLRERSLEALLKKWAPNCVIVPVDQVTEGAACTVLLAESLINNTDQLMIANCDQYVEVDIDRYLSHQIAASLDGLIMTMTAHDPKWSFAKLDDQGLVVNVVEKQVISDEATVGIYNFLKGSDFVEAAHAMIASNERVNGEFYVAPTYNGLIKNKKKIGVFNIGPDDQKMHGLGTPEDLDKFLGLARFRQKEF
jgi:NDP-sugar pyrophosphorylase family protein